MAEQAKSQLSEEEMKAKREEMIKNMEEELPKLRIEAEYYGLITQIETDRFTRMQVQQQMVGMMMAQQEQMKKDPASSEATLEPQQP